MTPAEDRQWDGFLAGCRFGHHEQSSAYAASRVAFGFQPERVIVYEDSRIVGGAQILVKATPIGKVGLVFKGPVSLDDDPGVMREVARRLDDMARAGLCGSIRADFFPGQEVARQALAKVGFEPSVAWERTREKTSVVVPLCGDEDEMLRQMHKKVAYNVRRSGRVGLTVKAGPDAPLEDFYRLHQATAFHQGFPVFPLDYFRYVNEVFGKRARAQYFVAYGDGEPRAAIFNCIVADQMLYGWGGMLRDADSRHYRANFLLHVEAMNWARRNGCARYDFVGNERFKTWFGNETIAWPKPYRKFYPPLAGLRRRILEEAHASRLGRRVINRLGGMLGSVRPMPW